MKSFTLSSSKNTEVIDITSNIKSCIKEEQISEGICNVFVLHTTCALMVAELDTGTDQDYLQAIDKIFPEGNYRHAHNPAHVGDHIMSSIIGNSVSIPVKNGQPVLGTWQSIVMVELNGPRQRNLLVHFN